MISEHVELAAECLLARKLFGPVALFLLKLPSHFGHTHAGIKPVAAKPSVRLTLTVDQVSNVHEQIWQVELRRLASRRTASPVSALDAAFKLVQTLAYRLTIPAQFLLGAVRHSVEHLIDRPRHEQPPGVPSQRATRFLKESLQTAAH